MEVLYIGSHEPSWLGRVGVPLFISHRPKCCRWTGIDFQPVSPQRGTQRGRDSKPDRSA